MATTSKYGLTLYPTGNVSDNAVNELHVLNSGSLNPFHSSDFATSGIVNYDAWSKTYSIDNYLERIGTLYGNKFKDCVKLTLDYN